MYVLFDEDAFRNESLCHIASLDTPRRGDNTYELDDAVHDAANRELFSQYGGKSYLRCTLS